MNLIRNPSLLAAAAVALAASTLNAASGGIQHLRIIRTSDPGFPVGLALSPVSLGKACLAINVDADGRLIDWMVLSHTHQAFADSAVAALRSWKYEPARIDGRPVGVRAEVEFTFEARGKVVTVSPADVMEALFGHLEKVEHEVCRPREIDAPLRVVHSVAPGYPPVADLGRSGTRAVVVDFYVDREGRPRMPVILEGENDQLAAEAVGALSQWRFSTPTRGGRPVAVRAQQRFVFGSR